MNRSSPTTNDTPEQQKSQQLIELVKQAEALAFSSEWHKTAKKMRLLLNQWKALEPINFQVEREWISRFRVAQQTFMERRADYFLQGNIRKSAGLITQLTQTQTAIIAKKNEIAAHYQTLNNFENQQLSNPITTQELAIEHFIQESMVALQAEITQKETELRQLERALTATTSRSVCPE